LHDEQGLLNERRQKETAFSKKSTDLNGSRPVLFQDKMSVKKKSSGAASMPKGDREDAI
jgi:hypothetical protein